MFVFLQRYITSGIAGTGPEIEAVAMGRITLKNVDRAFGKVKVLHDINLDIRDGEMMVLVGPSGCGKSTLLRLIAGLDKPTDGKIEHRRQADVTHVLGGRSGGWPWCSSPMRSTRI